MRPHNAPSWTALVRRLAPDAELPPPAPEDVLAGAERGLGVAIPEALRAFLAEADGLEDDFGDPLIWPAAEIDRRNREFRSEAGFRELYMPFDSLLFFGDDGGGDRFAFAIQADGLIHKGDIYRWEHETDARSWFAPRLEGYLRSRLVPEAD